MNSVPLHHISKLSNVHYTTLLSVIGDPICHVFPTGILYITDISGYNAYRELCGLGRARDFDDLSNHITDALSRDILRRVYK